MSGLKRGDIVLVLFPHSDLVTFKRRPALVVQADDPNTPTRRSAAQAEVRVFRVAVNQAANPHHTLSLEKGEANHGSPLQATVLFNLL